MTTSSNVQTHTQGYKDPEETGKHGMIPPKDHSKPPETDPKEVEIQELFNNEL